MKRPIWIGLLALLLVAANPFTSFISTAPPVVPTGAELIPCVTGGITNRCTAQSIANTAVATSVSFGAICDGNSHPLSTKFNTLAAAQAVYPFITSLTQEIDYAAIKAMSNFSLGADGAEHGTANANLNKPMYIPPGICMLGVNTWKISKASGMSLNGGGMTSTIIQSNATAFQTDGLWYSQISNIQFATLATSTTPTVDIDGNVGGPGSSISVQGNTFLNLMVNGNFNVDDAFALCRQGGGNAQCSENILINPHLFSSNFASYYQNGFNALDNTIQGGDIQGFKKNGVYLVAGSVHIFGTSFEATGQVYGQVFNSSCDVNASASGTNDSIIVYGVRSEDLCIYLGAPSQFPDIRGVSQHPATLAWSANTAFNLRDSTIQTGADSKSHLFVVTTAGTSGGSAPTWPSSGTVTDGSVVWTATAYNSINVASGFFDLATSSIDASSTIVALGQSFFVGRCSPSQIAAGGTAYGFCADGSNAGQEAYVVSAGNLASLFANPTTAVTLASGLTLPANSAGLIGHGNGGLSALVISSGAFGDIHITAPTNYDTIIQLPTTCSGHNANATANHSGFFTVCPFVNQPSTYNSNSSAVAFTASAANVTGASTVTSFVELDLTGNPAAAAAVTTPTATAWIAAISDAAVNQTYVLRIKNSANTNTWTVTGGTGVTVNGAATVATGTWREFLMTITNVGTPAITLQNLGGGNVI